jgi:hypothetical protein
VKKCYFYCDLSIFRKRGRKKGGKEGKTQSCPEKARKGLGKAGNAQPCLEF